MAQKEFSLGQTKIHCANGPGSNCLNETLLRICFGFILKQNVSVVNETPALSNVNFLL